MKSFLRKNQRVINVTRESWEHFALSDVARRAGAHRKPVEPKRSAQTSHGMLTHLITIGWLVVLVGVMASTNEAAMGQDRFYEQDGLLIRETRAVERVPVVKIQWEERQQLVNTEQFQTVYRAVPETIRTPVVDYQFRASGAAWDVNPKGTIIPGTWYPYTRWNAQVQNRPVPQSVRQVVPEWRTVKVPVRTLGFMEQERTERVVLGPAPTQRY
jgi:hypothetical protein